MTEAQWLSSDDAAAMLAWLTADKGPSGYYVRHFSGRPLSDRRLRLFACACCRAVWPQLTDSRSRRAVEMAERYADGEATERELAAAAHGAWELTDGIRLIDCKPQWLAWLSAWDGSIANGLLNNYECNPVPAALQAALLRCIASNPFQIVGGLHRVMRQMGMVPWLSRDVARLAQVIYDERDFALMPLLADALEEAGCPAEEECHKGVMGQWIDWRPHPLLAHLRSPGPHVRGCWALDLLLGRE